MHRILPFLFLSAIIHAASLQDEFRLGKVVDFQGIAAVRPEMGVRWTPVGNGLLLRRGDWLRTDVRGANAVQVRLRDGGQLILGPGALLEMSKSGGVKLIRGEMEVMPPEEGVVKLQYGENSVKVKTRGVYRQSDAKVQTGLLPKDPNWLQGFKGVITTESMGSLLANVEGRNTPLTIGYHKVSVDIRDQIARTTIEESFVNHTNSRLEGVFYFPLPQDASISGFGMWINGELVEADVVEKQRAREIYETILRERRDPGLLEWNGGNIFKARVFPIFAHSEKRIKITYTQVLPMKKGKIRYSYALQSEMLRLNPLRELSLNVRVHSALPLKSFVCPTHEVRLTQTSHSAQAEFTAQEYTPKSDFEVELEVDAKDTPITIIPHQRGEDGYFLALINPPDDSSGWTRDLIRDSDRMKLMILADTSGSMDDSSRQKQDALLAALLGSLAEQDTFQLAACDVSATFLNPEPLSATEDNVIQARDFLNDYLPLGWSDLDTSFAMAMEHVEEGTQVIYIGDGVITKADSDPIAFANRLQRLYKEKGKGATFHAIAPGSSFESSVLKAIASLGGGSVRHVEGTNTPAAVARQLLLEITNPGIKDLEIEFNGLRTARVYPETLPNLQTGTQQIVIGRYLPQGKKQKQKGEVVVTGIQNGKLLKFRSQVSLANAESGNSFIPRLWARMHLDYLLEQGRSQSIKEDIIALSEEFHIMTPYTSFLVLESDADRERFGVKRRFRMRDGEKFFAEGRDQATLELLQKQMKLAGTWRQNLRRQILQQLSKMGKGVRMLQSHKYGAYAPGFGAPMSNTYRGKGKKMDMDYLDASEEMAVKDVSKQREDLEEVTFEKISEETELDDLALDHKEMPEPSVTPSAPMQSADPMELPVTRRPAPAGITQEMDEEMGSFGPGERRERYEKLTYAQNAIVGLDIAGGDMGASESYAHHGSRSSPYNPWNLYQFFPNLLPPQNFYAPKVHNWPDDAVKIAESLMKRGKLGKERPLRLQYESESISSTTGEIQRRSTTTTLINKGSWITYRGELEQSPTIAWSHKEGTGLVDNGFQFGRVRKQEELDKTGYPIEVSSGAFRSLISLHPNGKIELTQMRDNKVWITIRLENNPNAGENRYLIDTHLKVLMKHMYLGKDGMVHSTTSYQHHVEKGGFWWPTLVEMINKDEVLIWRQKLAVSISEEEAFQDTFSDLEKVLNQSVVLQMPTPTVEEAKQSLKDGKDHLGARLVLLHYFAASQQWEECDKHFEAIEKLTDNLKPLRWLRLRYFLMKRRSEELLELAGELAKEVAGNADMDSDVAYKLASQIRNEAAQTSHPQEILTLLDIIKPVYERATNQTGALQRWEGDRLNYLRSAGRQDEAIKFHAVLAEKYPKEHGGSYLRQIFYTLNDYDTGSAWLEKLLDIATKEEWELWRQEQLHHTHADYLENKGRFGDSLELYEELLKREPSPHHNWIHHRYLNALLRLDNVKKCFRIARKWLRGKDPSRISAATQIALNQQAIPEEFLAPLAAVVRKYALDESQFNLAATIITHYRFHRTDEARELRTGFWQRLMEEAGTLPLPAVQRLVGWVQVNDPVVEKESWKELVNLLEQRWSGIEEEQQLPQLGSLIVRLLASHGFTSENLRFLRKMVKTGNQNYDHHYRHQLFNALLNRPWREGLEEEAWKLLYTLNPNSEGLRHQLNQLLNWVLTKKYQSLVDAIPDKEGLSRKALNSLKQEKSVLVRKELIQRLVSESESAPESLLPWMQVEKLYLQVRIRQDLEQVITACWEYLDKHPITEGNSQNQEEALLYNRYLTTLEYLAVKPGGDRHIAKDLLKLYDHSIKQLKESNAAWKQRKYRLLVALDQPEEIAKNLESWIRPDKADNHWRRNLALVYAELNRIPEAIQQFEWIAKEDELKASEWRILANWYLVMKKQERHNAALEKALMTEPEHQLSNRIYQIQNRISSAYSRTGIPEDLDPETIRIFTVLMRKSRNPASYTHNLSQLYRYTKDFRLLQCLSEAVIGHSIQEIYPFLGDLNNVLQHIRDEAVVDTIMEHLESLRAKDITETDLRALNLLTMLVKRKASEVVNQPGPHVDAALTAMKAAFKGQWQDGERLRMARLLANLGRITQESLAKEQLRQLKALHNLEESGTDVHLQITQYWGQTLWHYEQHEQAIQVLESALDAYRESNDGRLTNNAQGPFNTLIRWLKSRSHYRKAEKEIVDEMELQTAPQMIRWLQQLLYDTWNEAFRAKATVSLGKGQELFRNAQKVILATLEEDKDQYFRYQVIHKLCSLYRIAHQQKLTEASQDLELFAYGLFGKIMETQQNNYQSLVNHVADQIHYVSGSQSGLAFLIHSYENEPKWFDKTNNTGWRMFGYKIAYWRQQAKEIGDLEPRLLKIVLKEIRRDLETRQYANRYIYSQGSYFWKKYAPNFEALMEEIYNERKDSGQSVLYIANYAWGGLRKRTRAIEMLEDAYKRMILDENGQGTLLNYLESEKQYNRAIEILIHLVEWRPDNLNYRTRLMRLYRRVEDLKKLIALLDQTEQHLRENNHWNETALSALGTVCVDTHLWERAIPYYNELIPLHQRTHANRGIGNGTLSSYYNYLSRAHSSLGNTVEAVEAASGAIVSWGSTHSNRKSAIQSLYRVLADSKDLDAYIQYLEQDVAESGLENPIIRKAVGQVLLQRKNRPMDAIHHLQIAVELQPNDLETHQFLIQAYDKVEAPEKALQQIFTAARLNRRDFKLYQDLADRFEKLEKPILAERSRTSIVEALPSEAESHQLLAQIRQKQDRWSDATSHWKQVAEIRALEPTGLLNLAKAQLQLDRKEEARKTIDKLLAKEWPRRFGNVHDQAQRLLRN